MDFVCETISTKKIMYFNRNKCENYSFNLPTFDPCPMMQETEKELKNFLTTRCQVENVIIVSKV